MQSRLRTRVLREGYADERSPRWHGSCRSCRPCITVRQSTVPAAAAVPATFSSRDHHVDAALRRPASPRTPTPRRNSCLRGRNRLTSSSTFNRHRPRMFAAPPPVTRVKGQVEDEPVEMRLGYSCSPPPLPSSHSPSLLCLARQTRKRKRRRWPLLASQRKPPVFWARDPGRGAILEEV